MTDNTITITQEYKEFYNQTPNINEVKVYETKAKDLGLAIKDKNRSKRWELLQWFWNKDLMEIPEWVEKDAVVNLDMLTWRTNIDLANTCFQLSL